MKIIQNNAEYSLKNISEIHMKLPVHTYSLKLNEYTGEYYLKQIDDIQMPTKIYGDVEAFASRVITKYNSTNRNLGVLCIGHKGSGKSLFARFVSAKLNLPVIIINEGFTGPNFTDFLTDPVLGNCVILIDEFEKIYNERKGVDTDQLLSLLDGPYNTHHLFLFTANEFYSINDSMKNRPSRIHFLKEYGSVSMEVVEEVADDLLDNKDYIPELLDVCDLIPELTFDILISLIKDCNLFKEGPKVCASYLNILLEKLTYTFFQVNPETETRERLAQRSLESNGKFDSNVWITDTVHLDPEDRYNFSFAPDDYIPVRKTKDEIEWYLEKQNAHILAIREKNSYLSKLF